jgi:2-amino-4-hydroxy-6-hydroxymethyldihydropteridine diphosphokinase
MDRLQELSERPIGRSSLWRSAPIDCPPGSPPFVNAVVEIVPRPDETPETLLTRLQTLEKEFGRLPKTILNEPRPLDLDLIAFGQRTCATPQLTLPHPRAHCRRFVLEPLAELAPDLVLPGQTKAVRELLTGLGSEQAGVQFPKARH